MSTINVNYDFYFSKFSLGENPALSLPEFETCKKEAISFLEGICHGDMADFGEEVKNCICALSEYICLEHKKEGIKTESIDGYSVTFLDEKGKNLRALKIAQRYLSKTGLLYAGVE